MIRTGDPNPADEKDRRSTKVIRFCPEHWEELQAVLPQVKA